MTLSPCFKPAITEAETGSAPEQPHWSLPVEQIRSETVISDVADPAQRCSSATCSSWSRVAPSGDRHLFPGSLLTLLVFLYSQGWKQAPQEGNSKIYIRFLPWTFLWRSLFLHRLHTAWAYFYLSQTMWIPLSILCQNNQIILSRHMWRWHRFKS